jgi:nucleotide-binding universal stress UspA family protein
VEVGHPVEQILDVVTRDDVDLIVMGTHGHTGFAHAVLGSVAERVVRLAPCPVLTVKHVEEG